MNDKDTDINLVQFARKTIGDTVALRVESDPNESGLVLVAGRPGLEHDFDYVDPDQIRPFLVLARGASVASIVAQLKSSLIAARVRALVVRELERSRRCPR